jgi:uncharacterized membrane protein YccC
LLEQAADRETRLIDVLDRLDATLQQNNTALADMREQVRANTQAVLRVLDRLDGGEQPA